MALLYISEYVKMVAPGPEFNGTQAPAEPGLDQSPVNIQMGTANSSAAFASSTRFVRLHCDTICSVVFGTAPTAVTTNKRLAANQTEFFGVPENGGFKVSVIGNT